MERVELARLLGPVLDAVKHAPGAIVISEPDPARFMQVFGAAVADDRSVFLADPAWGKAERSLLQEACETEPEVDPGNSGRGWLMIPTGGSTGGMRFARHDQVTLSAAVRGFCMHFGTSRVNAVSVLPLHHVSGLMSWMRCALTDGKFLACDWREIEAGRRPRCGQGEWVISLVPTQLQRLLASAEAVT